MSHFHYQGGELYAEACSLSAIAEHYGTPCYVYSRAELRHNYLAYANALGQHPGAICYAVKANSNIAVLQVLAELGAGFDIVSKGELQRVLAAGGDASRVIFSGVGKTRDEMVFALKQGIGCFNVESVAELELLSRVAVECGISANVSLRVNPDVDAQTHPYISTGLKENKFGVDFAIAEKVYQRAADLPMLNIVGVDCHIGSQLTQLAPFMDALDRLLVLVDALAAKGIAIQHIDLGGGLGVCYENEQPPTPETYFSQVKQKIADRKLAIYMEPGRSISANAGVLLTEVLYLKPTDHRNFAIIDAAMNDNIRPALYQAWQNVLPLKEGGNAKAANWDLVGPVCETGDFLAKQRELKLSPGDCLAVMSSGAYGFVMSSNYNTRGRAAEVMVDADQHYLVRERESFDTIIAGERLLPEDQG